MNLVLPQKILDSWYECLALEVVFISGCYGNLAKLKRMILSSTLMYSLITDAGKWDFPLFIWSFWQRSCTDSCLDIGVLEQCFCTSPWCAPLISIPERDGCIRFIADFQELNKAVIRHPCSMPHISVMLGYMHCVLDGISNQNHVLLEIPEPIHCQKIALSIRRYAPLMPTCKKTLQRWSSCRTIVSSRMHMEFEVQCMEQPNTLQVS
jgi:hypothetical protein